MTLRGDFRMMCRGGWDYKGDSSGPESRARLLKQVLIKSKQVGRQRILCLSNLYFQGKPPCKLF